MSGKHSNSRRFLSLLLSLSMIAQTCVAGFAAEPETVPAVTEVQTETATAPETTAPETQASETQASETAAPGTQVPETAAPETQVPETAAPETQVPETAAPESEVTVPETAAPEPEIAQQEETAAQTESEVRRNKVTFEYAEGQAIVFVKNTDLLSTGKAAEAEDGKILFTVKAAEGYEVTSVKVDRTSDARKSGNPDDPDEYIIEGILTDSTVVTVEARLKETEAPAEIETETEKQPEEAETETETAAPGTEDSFPAITATRTAANGVTVNISAEEGAFPAGTTLVVRSASRYEAMTAAQDVIEDGKKVVDAVAVDISFVKDDAEIQPTDPSLVHVSLSLADALEGTEHEVVHVEDSGETSVVADASATGAQFQSEGFSVYAIIGTEDGKNEEIARATYNFVLDDDTPYYFKDTTGKTTNSQILIEGDKLTAPQDPTKDGASFTGWLLDGKAFDISAFTQAAITADETHTVKASFTDKVYATFYDTDGTTALAKLEPDADGNVIYSGIEAAPDQPHQKFVGWASAPNSTVAEHEGPSGTITGVTQDISLYPVFAPAYTITYSIPHGAQYLAPDTFFTDEATAAPAIYQEGSADLRTGYTFAGWYTDEALKTPYSWGGNLTSDITLYSKWEVSSTTYTVQFWKESLDGDYDFAGKIVENANTGDTAVIADEYKSYGNTKAGVSDFTGFAYDADKTDAEYADLKYKTVSGDGSTVLNVYYKRNTITIRFHYGTLTESRWYEGYYTFDEDRVETYSGKYEQPLDNWPEGSFTELNEYSYGYYTKGSGISFLTAYKLPDNKATEIDYYQEKEGTGSDVYFYLEQADGNYTLAKDYKTDAGSFSITDKYAGYQAHHYKTRSHNNGNNWEQQQQHNVSTPDADGSYAVIMLASRGGWGGVTRYDLAIYFNLKTSMVHFVDTLNSEQDITTQSVKYTAKIADPGNPAVTHDGYTFKGWFKDAGCTVPFDFANEAMPANDLKIYAGWDAKKYSVHLDVNGGTLPEGHPEGHPEGQTDRFWITFDRKIDPQNPYWTENGQPDGTQVALFTGWTRKNDGTSYTTGKRPTDADVSGEYDWGGDVGTIPEIELTANWKMVGSYTVTIVYTDKDGNPQKVTGASYADGAIAKAPLSVPYTPDGKALTGWTIEKNDTNLSLGQEFIVDAVSMGEKDADGNYVITITPVYSENGPLDVTSVTFNGNGGTVVGENVVGLAMNGTFTMADATREGYTLLGWSTNANATEAQFTAGKEYAANDVNGNTLYAVWARDVYVTVTGNTDSKVYSGADQSVTGHTDEFKDIDGNVIDAANFTVTVADSADTATGKDAGIYYMTMSGSDSHQVSAEGASAGKVTVTSNVASYVIKNITVKDGSLTITPIAVELTANSATKEYDGTALTDSGYEITKGAFVSGEGLATVTVVGSQTLAGSSKNKITAHTLKEGTKAENYTITYVDGTLTVTNKDKIKITITADSDEKTYDGSALIKDSYTITSGELKSGDQIASVTVTGSQTDAGTSANVPSAARIMHGSDDVTDYYEISYVNGTLRVKPVAIELTADSDSKEYDGTPLTKNSYKITSGAFVGEDGLASVTVEGSQTLVGSSENKITAHTLKEGTKKDNYTITYVDGKLTVTNENKIKITITADSDEKTYDSTALTKNSYALTAGELKSGDKITSVTVAGSQTDAGTSANKASDAKIMHGDADVTSYYEITYADGKLTVNPVAIELTADSGTKVYDGTPLAKDSYQITSGKFVGEDGLASVMVEGSQTLVGSSDNTITAHTLKEGTKAENYSITYKPGTLTVTDGTPDEPVDPGKVVTKTHEGNKFKLGETITWTIKVKNIYDEVKTITLTELDGVELKQSVFKDVAAGAEITTTATHVVTEADILNGKFHNDVKVEFSGEDKPFHGEDEPTTEDPKPHITVTKKVTSTPAIGESYVEGETIRYSVTAKNDGNLTLTEVVVTDALTGDSWTIDGSFAPGAEKTFETSYVVTAADAAAGTVKNVATATGKGPDGHDPEVVPGEVEEPTHPKYELAIEANSEKAAYDGKEHTAAGLKETKFTVEGKDYTVAAVTEDPVQTNAGTYTNNIDKASIVVKDADGKDVTALFQVATTDGSLIIGKRKITVTADSDEKKYDGTPLTDPDYSVTEGSLADGDTLTAKTEGSQTLVGSSANRIQEGSVRIFTQRTNAAKKAGLRLFAAAPAGGELTEVTDNYEITTKDGTLTVTDGTADDPVDPTKVVTKSHEGNEFKLGETITWTIKVKNIYDEAKTITLTELDGVELEQSVFENVAAGAEITAVATHVVTEADILSGKFHNDVKAEFSGEDKPFHGEDDPTTEKKNPHITITKTVTNSPKSGDAFVEAETIEYSVAVENDGNVTISNAVVTDELTGDSWTIETLAPGQTNSFEAVYEVTAEDVKAGKVTNVATATGKDPSGDEPEVVPGKAETKTKAKAEPAKPETETPKDGPVAPKTGDNNPLMLYLLLLLGSGAIIGGAQLRRRKREDGAQ